MCTGKDKEREASGKREQTGSKRQVVRDKRQQTTSEREKYQRLTFVRVDVWEHPKLQDIPVVCMCVILSVEEYCIGVQVVEPPHGCICTCCAHQAKSKRDEAKG